MAWAWVLKASVFGAAPEHRFLFVTGSLWLARYALYLQGVFVKDAEARLFLYGTEYCAAGYTVWQFGAPNSFAIFLFVLGFLTLTIEYFVPREPSRL